jgi:hypothetical protein
MESDVPTTSSSSNMTVAKIADKTTPKMIDYWKKTVVTEVDRKAYHSFNWLNGGMESSVPIVEYPIVDGTIVVCFVSHLIAGLGLMPSKFLIAVMSRLGCELVHLNPNAIIALSCFTMLCECWLGMRRSSSPGSDCLFVATAGRSTSVLLSRAAGKVVVDGGSLSICMSNLNG